MRQSITQAERDYCAEKIAEYFAIVTSKWVLCEMSDDQYDKIQRTIDEWEAQLESYEVSEEVRDRDEVDRHK
ncbi:hypothetical protein NQ117_05540 [Paenibacillus sp. SC116]|uniref:hypothetical protein n=1 Tax=Paenibacillus sp. SC116 TaxID=2968986 RepID=UPI00215B100A|nr:hypothetical protein [Paenibacillus sp. SC116]MCR8843136.1 hypothetical protein [Paenibacillus sp. SC116]